jgi:TPR repeat protein
MYERGIGTESSLVAGTCSTLAMRLPPPHFALKDARMCAPTALRWYMQAAMKGHIKAQLKVGRMYEEGKVRKKHDLEAFGWYLNAAKKGQLSSSR